jgi:hypothetical protein
MQRHKNKQGMAFSRPSWPPCPGLRHKEGGAAHAPLKIGFPLFKTRKRGLDAFPRPSRALRRLRRRPPPCGQGKPCRLPSPAGIASGCSIYMGLPQKGSMHMAFPPPSRPAFWQKPPQGKRGRPPLLSLGRPPLPGWNPDRPLERGRKGSGGLLRIPGKAVLQPLPCHGLRPGSQKPGPQGSPLGPGVPPRQAGRPARPGLKRGFPPLRPSRAPPLCPAPGLKPRLRPTGRGGSLRAPLEGQAFLWGPAAKRLYARDILQVGGSPHWPAGGSSPPDPEGAREASGRPSPSGGARPEAPRGASLRPVGPSSPPCPEGSGP